MPLGARLLDARAFCGLARAMRLLARALVSVAAGRGRTGRTHRDGVVAALPRW